MGEKGAALNGQACGGAGSCSLDQGQQTSPVAWASLFPACFSPYFFGSIILKPQISRGSQAQTSDFGRKSGHYFEARLDYTDSAGRCMKVVWVGVR